MLEFNSARFVHVTTLIATIRASLDILASQFEANAIGAGGPYRSVISPDLKNDLIALSEELEALGLPMSKRSFDRLVGLLQNGSVLNPNAMKAQMGDFNNRLKDELESRCFLCLSDNERDLFAPINPHFGEEVRSKFPSALYDIDEAAKCMALGRATASVFHSIRSLEAGIRAISRCLNIPDPTKGAERSWMKMLGNIKDGFDRRWPNSADRYSGDGQLFEGIYGALTGIQNPYRNATMHLDAKYSEDEAKHIFEMVRGIMMKIASRMDEQGLPLA